MIYMDNAATAKPCVQAVRAANKVMEECFGNPSSLHSMGIEAEKAVNSARSVILREFPLEGDIIFTSGATESNNTAINGICEAYRRMGNRIVTTAIEHPSAERPLKAMENKGFEVVRLRPSRERSFEDDIIAAVNEKTILLSYIAVNNETGFKIDTKKVYYQVKRKFPKCIIHADAVQGFCKIPVYADTASVSAHKIHGIKGCGALFIAKGTRFAPLLLGGGQQKDRRSGTEPVELIAAFSAAVSAYPCGDENFQKLNTYLLQQLDKIDGIAVNSYNNVSNILNFSVMGVRSEIMLHMLSEHGIYVSSGSACSKGAISTVLEAFGIGRERADCAVRVSFSNENTVQEIDILCKYIKEAIDRVRR